MIEATTSILNSLQLEKSFQSHTKVESKSNQSQIKVKPKPNQRKTKGKPMESQGLFFALLVYNGENN